MLALPEHTIRNHTVRGVCLPKSRENVRPVLCFARLCEGLLQLLQLGDLLHAQPTGQTFDPGPILVAARPFIGVPKGRMVHSLLQQATFVWSPRLGHLGLNPSTAFLFGQALDDVRLLGLSWALGAFLGSLVGVSCIILIRKFHLETILLRVLQERGSSLSLPGRVPTRWPWFAPGGQPPDSPSIARLWKPRTC